MAHQAAASATTSAKNQPFQSFQEKEKKWCRISGALGKSVNIVVLKPKAVCSVKAGRPQHQKPHASSPSDSLTWLT